MAGARGSGGAGRCSFSWSVLRFWPPLPASLDDDDEDEDDDEEDEEEDDEDDEAEVGE